MARQRSRAWMRSVGWLVAVSLVVLGPATPARAADAGLSLSAAATSASVTSGSDMIWTFSWACASTTADCVGAKLTIPIPVSAPNGVAAAARVVGTTGYTTSATVSGGVATYTFIDPLPAGSSGQVSLIMTSTGGATPNGETYTPVGTFSATNADPVTVTAPAVTVTSSLTLAITKTRLPATLPATTPSVIGSEVSYQVTVSPGGSWWTRKAVVTDPLPAGAEFVSASGGGVYDAATNAVTWTLDSGSLNARIVGTYLRVVVRYPDTAFTPCASCITNTATATAWGVNDHDSIPDATASGSTTHGLVAPASGGGPSIGFTKTSPTGHTVRGGWADWNITWGNTGDAAGAFSFTDVVPCIFSNTPTPAAGTVCSGQLSPTALMFSGNWGPSPSSPVTVTFTYSDGSTATNTFTTNYAYLGFSATPAGQTLYSITVEGTLQPGETMGATYRVTVPESTPETAGTTQYTIPSTNLTSGAIQVENCLTSASFGATASSMTPVDTSRKCGSFELWPTPMVMSLSKSMTPTTGTWGDTLNVHLPLNRPSLPTKSYTPSISDLLPPELSYVAGSANVTSTATEMPAADATVSVIDNYQGTGRTLVTASWPASDAFANNVRPTGSLYLDFKVKINAGVSAGAYKNTVWSTTATTPTRDQLSCYAEGYGADTSDIDNDGNTAEWGCYTSATFNVVPLGAMSITKEVWDAQLGQWVKDTAVADTTGTGAGTYRLTFTNEGSATLQRSTFYDILPHDGDVGSGPRQTARGSEWQASLTDVPTVPAGVVVEYSASTNPCRGDVLTAGGTVASGPSGCTDDWTTTPPADLSTVRALRFSRAADLVTYDTIQVEIPVTAPSNALGTAWNSAGATAFAKENAAWVEPTESQVVGLEPQADLSLTKTLSGVCQAGKQISYTVGVTNGGVGKASSVVVGDAWPTSDVSYLTSTATQGSYDPSTGVWTVGSVNAGETQLLTLVGVVDRASSTITNSAQVVGADQPDPDSTVDNMNGATVAEDDEAAIACEGVTGISGTVWDDADGSAGGTFSGIQSTGETGTDASGLVAVLVDATGNVLQVVPVAADGTYAFDGVQPSIDVTVQITSSATAPAVGSPAGDPQVPDGWINTSPLTQVSFNTGTAAVTDKDFGIEQPPNTNDKSVTAQVNPGPVNVQVPSLTGTDPEDGSLGSGDTFQIVTLPDPTTGVLYYDGVAVTAGQIISGYDAAKLTVIPAAGNVSVVFTVAAVDAAGVPDPTPATITMPFFVQDADLSVTKSIVAGCCTAGGPITYQITVSNAGPGVGTAVVVRDTLKSGGTITSGSASRGTFDTSTGVWTVGTLPVGATASVTVVVAAPKVTGMRFTNTAQVTSAGEPDPDSTPNDMGGSTPSEDDEAAVTATLEAGGGLAFTGVEWVAPSIAGLLLITVGGVILFGAVRRRRENQ